MKIGFLRSGQSFDIDFYTGSASALGTDLRVPIMEALVNMGHTCYVLGIIPKKQHWLLQRPEEHPHHDYRWIKNVVYSPEEIPRLDLLVVECSTTNAFFGEKNLKRLIEVLRNTYETTCVVYQHGDASHEINVPLGDFYFPEGKKSLIAQWSIGLKTNGNRWILWTHATRPELIRETDSNRMSYRRFIEEALYIPMGYSRNFDRPLVNVERDIDIMYIGRQKTKQRTQRLKELAGETDCCSKMLYGKWDQPPPGWDYGGFIPGHGKVYELLPRAKVSLCVADPWFYRTGTLTTRVVQTIRSGAAALMDAEWKTVGSVLVQSHDEVHTLLPKWKEINEAQREILPTWEESLLPALEHAEAIGGQKTGVIRHI